MRTDHKQRQEAEQLTLFGQGEISGNPGTPNALLISPNGERTIEVDATPEALLQWARAGWMWRWLKDNK